jgi:type II secretion system protein H
MKHRRSGFTLIEMMLALAIAVIITFMAMPSLRGLSAEKRLTESFDRFDALARKAQKYAVQQQRSWTILWEQQGKQVSITLRPDELATPSALPDGSGDTMPQTAADNQQDQSETISLGPEENYTIERPVALVPAAQAPAQWTFWRSGTCEPAIIRYSGPAGTWVAQYHPLTGHGEITEQHIR